ncbi:MAG: MFS transporter [Ignavibacteriales bacterium]|nr:MFS transporter [Ignavibacteriales bacterium]
MPFKKPEPWRRTLYIIWAAQFITMMGMSLVVPFLPFYIQTLGVTSPDDVARWSGYVFSGPFFISFFLTPIWGLLGDRYGRRIMVIRAVFGLAISQALIGLSQNVEMLFLFRMLQGALSGFIAAALALVSTTTPREHTGYALGLLQTASASGGVIGPLVGGSIADTFGYRPLFYLVAFLCTISGILILRYVEEPPREHDRAKVNHTLAVNLRSAFESPSIRAALILIFLSQVALLIVQPIFALYVESLEPVTTRIATLAGAIFSITGVFMVISSPWWGRRNDTKSYKKNLTMAISGAAVSCFAQGFVVHAYQLLVLRALQGFCVGGILPSLYSYVSKHSSPSRRGGIIGIASSSQVLANVVGPTTGGYIAAATGLRANFFVTGALLTASLLFLRRSFVDMRGSEELGTIPERLQAVDDAPPLDAIS